MPDSATTPEQGLIRLFQRPSGPVGHMRVQGRIISRVPNRAVPRQPTVASTDSYDRESAPSRPRSARPPRPLSGDTDLSFMARYGAVRVRPWSFAIVRRVADLPCLFAGVR